MAKETKNEVVEQPKKDYSVTYQVNGEEVTLSPTTIKNYLSRGDADITAQEAILFMNLCKYQKLNPFLNEAFLIKFDKTKPAQMVVGKEAFMKKAENNEVFEGYRAGLIVSRDNEILEIEGSFTAKGDTLLGGWCEVYRADRKFPIIAKVSFDEYSTGKSLWAGKPKTMIRKVAIVQAMREAFPSNLGGMYVEEEVDFETLPAQDEPKQKEANSKPLKIKDEPTRPPVEEIQDAQIIDPDEEPDF